MGFPKILGIAALYTLALRQGVSLSLIDRMGCGVCMGIGLATLGGVASLGDVVGEFGTWLASLGARVSDLGCAWRVWERGPLAR